MLHYIRFIAFIFLFLSTQTANAQDIISKDGFNMGPREKFLDVCAKDENGQVIVNYKLGYSSLDFCNCLAEDMIPTMTKKEINYYFAQNNHTKIFRNPELSKIAQQCMIDAKSRFEIVPPPQEDIRLEVQKEVPEYVSSISHSDGVDSIISLVNYETKFDEVLSLTIEQHLTKSKISESHVKDLKSKIKFSNIDPEMITIAYSGYSVEDIEVILEFLSSLSKNELEASTIKYETRVIEYFDLYIQEEIETHLK